MLVFPSDFAFLEICCSVRSHRGAQRDAPCSAARRRRAARNTAFFPPKTQKFACRFCGNAYYDRMKRVSPPPVVKSAGD
jgi:hypothetical protein